MAEKLHPMYKTEDDRAQDAERSEAPTERRFLINLANPIKAGVDLPSAENVKKAVHDKLQLIPDCDRDSYFIVKKRVVPDNNRRLREKTMLYEYDEYRATVDYVWSDSSGWILIGELKSPASDYVGDVNNIGYYDPFGNMRMLSFTHKVEFDIKELYKKPRRPKSLDYHTVNFLTPSNGDLPHPRYVRRELARSYGGELGECRDVPILIRGEFEEHKTFGTSKAPGRTYYYKVYENKNMDDDSWTFFGWLYITHQTKSGLPWFYVFSADNGDEIVFRHPTVTNTEIDFEAGHNATEEDASLNPDGTAKFIKLNFENPVRGKLPSPKIIRADLAGRRVFDYAGTQTVLIAQSECERRAGKTFYHHNLYSNDGVASAWTFYGEIHQRVLLCGGRVKYGIQLKNGELLTMYHRDDVDESLIMEHVLDRVKVDSDTDFAVVENVRKGPVKYNWGRSDDDRIRALEADVKALKRSAAKAKVYEEWLGSPEFDEKGQLKAELNEISIHEQARELIGDLIEELTALIYDTWENTEWLTERVKALETSQTDREPPSLEPLGQVKE